MKRRRGKEGAGLAAAREVSVATRSQPVSSPEAHSYVTEAERGQQLLDEGQVRQAVGVFQDILVRLGETPSFERAVILGRLGRCYSVAGRPDMAIEHVREA